MWMETAMQRHFDCYYSHALDHISELRASQVWASPKFCGKTSWLSWKAGCCRKDQVVCSSAWARKFRWKPSPRTPPPSLRARALGRFPPCLRSFPGRHCRVGTCSCGRTGNALSCSSSRSASRWPLSAGWRAWSSWRASRAPWTVRALPRETGCWRQTRTQWKLTGRTALVVSVGRPCLQTVHRCILSLLRPSWYDSAPLNTNWPRNKRRNFVAVSL